MNATVLFVTQVTLSLLSFGLIARWFLKGARRKHQRANDGEDEAAGARAKAGPGRLTASLS